MKRFLSAFAAAALAAPLFVASPALAQNVEQIASIQAGASACKDCNLFQADYSYAEITNRDLSGSRLRQADLSLAIMDGVNFGRANLSVVNGYGGRFDGANFAGADLSEASFVGAWFGRANFAGANLKGANFSGASMTSARGLTQAQLSGACGDAMTELPPGLTIRPC